MKKYREYIILIGIIIILLLIISINKNKKIHYTLPSITKIKKENITKIKIKKGNNKDIIIKKINNKWIIDTFNYKADTKKVDFILKDIENLQLTSLVSKSKDYYRYSLDNEKQIHIVVFNKNKKLIGFSIGKLGPNFNTTYIKLDNNPNVYLAMGNLRLSFDTDLDDIRDKIILSFNKEKIKSIEVKYNKKYFKINKINNKWEINNKKEIEDKKINEILNILNNIKCESFLYKPISIKNSLLLIKIILKGKDLSKKLIIYKVKQKDEERYIGKSSDISDFFILPEYKVEEIKNKLKKIND